MDIPALIKDYYDKDDFLLSRLALRPIPEQERKRIIAQRQAQQQLDQKIQNNEEVPFADLEKRLEQVKKQAPAGGQQKISL